MRRGVGIDGNGGGFFVWLRGIVALLAFSGDGEVRWRRSSWEGCYERLSFARRFRAES